MLLDQFMVTYTQFAHMSRELQEGWRQYITHVITSSEPLFSFYERNKRWYALPVLDEVMAARRGRGTPVL
jgi:hypothetical protein